jgi:Cu(I)/Ag(I) efflux system membrane fusion protein
MSKPLVLLSLALLLAVCGGSSSEPVRVRSGAMELSVSVEPEALRVGKNRMWLELFDERGEPVAGAHVSVKVHMHAMGAMPAMGGPSLVTEPAPGRYRADFELEMGSTWQVEIEADHPGAPPARAEGSLTVGTPGVRLEGIGARAPERAEAAPEPEAHPAEFRVDPARLQRVGVRVAAVESKPLEMRVRAVGRVVAEETTLEDVALKVAGFVGRVEIDAVGEPVEKGQVLFTVYSPELYAAQEEYLQALRSQRRARETGAPDRADYLVRAARNRLRLWDLDPADLERIAARGTPLEHLPIRSRVTGHVIEKSVVDGSAFAAGERLYRIAPLSRVWVEAEVYESELPMIAVGQSARVELPYHPDRSYDARVDFVYPTLDPRTRTARVRLALPNPDLALRPDMYANVELRVDRGERLLVPLSAVLQAGERSFVFRALGDGRFRPQEIELGMRSGEDVEVRSGLAAGDRIVASGTFLIASESRLRAALEQW